MKDTVLLVRHARSAVDSQRPAYDWGLAEGARDEARRMLQPLTTMPVDLVVSSPELKSVETADVVMAITRAGVICDTRLAEQGRDAPWFDDAAAFEDAVTRHFAEPEAIVLGEESSRMAAERFALAVRDAHMRSDCPVLVSHGRVMAAWVAAVCDVEAMPVWRSLRMPDLIAVDIAERRWRSLVEPEG